MDSTLKETSVTHVTLTVLLVLVQMLTNVLVVDLTNSYTTELVSPTVQIPSITPLIPTFVLHVEPVVLLVTTTVTLVPLELMTTVPLVNSQDIS
jgi:hypothetical protein